MQQFYQLRNRFLKSVSPHAQRWGPHHHQPLTVPLSPKAPLVPHPLPYVDTYGGPASADRGGLRALGPSPHVTAAATSGASPPHSLTRTVGSIAPRGRCRWASSTRLGSAWGIRPARPAPRRASRS
jgi:hypothetical protein